MSQKRWKVIKSCIRGGREDRDISWLITSLFSFQPPPHHNNKIIITMTIIIITTRDFTLSPHHKQKLTFSSSVSKNSNTYLVWWVLDNITDFIYYRHRLVQVTSLHENSNCLKTCYMIVTTIDLRNWNDKDEETDSICAIENIGKV